MNRVSALALSMLFVLGGPVFGQAFVGEVTGVRDGDTIYVLQGGNTFTVQLHGIDAPEPSQPYGKQATNFLRRRVAGKEVQVRVRDRDRYGRLVSSVVLNGRDVNAQLLRAGLAWYYWWYENYTPDARRDQTREYRAQQADRGLWAQATPIPPWEWRDENRGVLVGESGPTGLRYSPEDSRRTCADFDTQQEAQRFLDAALPGAADRLDADGDGLACEQLPSE